MMPLLFILCLFAAHNTLAIGEVFTHLQISPPIAMQPTVSVPPKEHGSSNSPAIFMVNYRWDSQATIDKLENTQRKAADLLRLTSNEINSDSHQAQLGVSMGFNDYVVTIGLGTPSSPQTVEFTTSGDICWVQCAGCTDCNDDQDHQIFDPTKSSSFSHLPCSSPACKSFNKNSCTAAGNCKFNLLDNSSVSERIGHAAQDVLNIGKNDAVSGFVFGCWHDNQVNLVGATGSFGLSRGPFSLVTQTSKTYGNSFSYCLPRRRKSSGFLALGEPTNNSSISYTPMLDTLPSAYTLSLVGIVVYGDILPIQPSIFSSVPNIIDSGPVITYLPPEAYRTLKTAFVSHMSEYPTAPAYQMLDTCFNFTGRKTVALPDVSLIFDGDAVMDLDLEGMLFIPPEYPYVGCLAFAEMQGVVIIGTRQQGSFEVVYDIGKKRIGFRPNAC